MAKSLIIAPYPERGPAGSPECICGWQENMARGFDGRTLIVCPVCDGLCVGNGMNLYHEVSAEDAGKRGAVCLICKKFVVASIDKDTLAEIYGA